METEYSMLTEDTRKLINKAIDIFDNLVDKDIKYALPRDRGVLKFEFVDYSLNNDEKVELSLFLAGLELEGNIKNVLDKYPELQKIYRFFHLEKEDVEKFSIREANDKDEYYRTIYRIHFIPILLRTGILWETANFKPEMCPEVIFQYLYLSKFFSIFSFDKLGIKEFTSHPSYEDINKLVDKRKLERFPYIDIDNKKNIDIDKFIKGLEKESIDQSISELDKENKDWLERRYGELPKQQAQEVKIEEEQLWQLLDEIKAKFIGQEDVCEKLFYNLLTNQMLAREGKVQDGERSIIFLDGPTGTGKTAISREITEKFGAPFVRTSSTNYSATGYVGGDLEDILKELYEQSNRNLEKAERGIIVFDEFEKISYNSDQGRDLVMKQAIQHRLLDFMGGGKYQITLGKNYEFQKISFDTSKLTFICAGALTSLREKKTEVRPGLGFGAEAKNANIESYSITSEDLINLGLERELVGRLNTFLHTEEYSKESLYRILKESEISPIKGLIDFVSKRNKKLEIEEDAYLEMAEEAYKLNTGARSLQTVVNSLRSRLLKEIFRGQDMVIKIDADMVRETFQDMTSRKARR